MLFDDVSIVVIGYDPYIDVWNHYFELLNKYWKDRLVYQIIAVVMVLLQLKNSVNNRLVRMVGYYGMAVLAQHVALFKGMT